MPTLLGAEFFFYYLIVRMGMCEFTVCVWVEAYLLLSGERTFFFTKLLGKKLRIFSFYCFLFVFFPHLLQQNIFLMEFNVQFTTVTDTHKYLPYIEVGRFILDFNLICFDTVILSSFKLT